MKNKPKKLQSKTGLSKKNLLLFGVIFAAVGGYILWRGLAAPAPPTIYLSPASQTIGPNGTMTVQIRENSGASTVNAVQANFSYPSTLFSCGATTAGYNSTTKISGDISLVGGSFTTVAELSCGSGQVSIGLGMPAGGGTISGDQLVATITFHSSVTSGSGSMNFTSGTALVNSVTNTDLLASLAATGGGTYTVDATAPTVSVTAPANGSSLAAGSTATVSATASDASSSITKVEIYIDGALASTLTASPYNYSWNTTGVSLATHTIMAKAYDTFNNIGTSATNTVTVADQTPPTVSLTSPASGSFLKGAVSMAATAAANTGGTGLAKVEFYADGILKNTDTVSPYSFGLDSTTLANGIHSLTAKAYDNATPVNSATSAAVSVTIDNSAPTAPTSLRTTSTTINSIILAWNAATDNNAVTGYQISRNGTLVTTVGAAVLTYTDVSLATGTTFNYSVTAVDAAGNTSPAALLSAATLAPKPGDLNGDNQVNITDLSILLSNYGTTNAVADVNKNGKVDIIDLSILLTNYGS
jgi:hypothetical protein